MVSLSRVESPVCKRSLLLDIFDIVSVVLCVKLVQNCWLGALCWHLQAAVAFVSTLFDESRQKQCK